MAASCRFAFAVHVLAVLALQRDAGSACSDRLARSVNTNPVVIRRLLAQLKKAGLVCTQKGSSGGAKLCEKPEDVSLDAVYRAVELAPSFGTHRKQPNQKCPVGAGIEQVLDEVFASAQTALETELAHRTLRDVLDAMDAAAPGRKAA
jgi:Rrf2 family protein